MTVSSLTFTCDMCGKKEVVDLIDVPESDISRVGTELVFCYPGSGSHTIEVCDSCLDEIKTFIDMYPKKGE